MERTLRCCSALHCDKTANVSSMSLCVGPAKYSSWLTKSVVSLGHLYKAKASVRR